MVSRRKLLVGFSIGTLSAVFPSLAQLQTRVRRIGFIAGRSRPASLEADAYGGFVSGLRELGYVEGKNITIEWRFADGLYERLPGLMAELLQARVEVVLAAAAPAAQAARQATTTVPIVFGGVGDPVGIGLVASLARPGGNITGVSNQAVDLSNKNLEFLLAIVPRLSSVALLLNPGSPIAPGVAKQVKSAARSAGVAVTVFEAGTQGQLEYAFGAMVRSRSGALIVAPDPYYFGEARRIAELALKHRLPAIGSYPDHAVAGGLISYGQDQAENYRRAAAFVDKILKGAKPGELPVEQPTKFELVINMKAAKALGIRIPQSILVRADRVIE